MLGGTSMNVNRLEGRVLNLWVAKSAGLKLSDEPTCAAAQHDPDSSFWHPHSYNPANDWSHAGAIIANNWFAIEDRLQEWFGAQWPHVPTVADDPLLWFMRAYVATRFGDSVEDVVSTVFEEAPSYRTPKSAQELPAAKNSLRTWYRNFFR
jgi:hypothetical protein